MEDFTTGWYGVTIGIRNDEIDMLIERLNFMKNEKEQHFHITSNYEGEGGIGDIEIYLIEEDQKSNMFITGYAIIPNR
jgi:hypothetical protein